MSPTIYSESEVTNISRHGFWLLTHETELFLSFDDFPWFKNQPVNKIFNLEEPATGHFHWPELDIDLSIEMIKDPGKFPLVSK